MLFISTYRTCNLVSEERLIDQYKLISGSLHQIQRSLESLPRMEQLMAKLVAIEGERLDLMMRQDGLAFQVSNYSQIP